MQQYQIILTVQADSLGAAITAVTPLIGEQRVVLGPITLVEPPKRRGGGRGGSLGSAGRTINSPVGRRKGQRLEPHEHRPSVMMLEALRTGPCSIDDLVSTIAPEGYAANTAKARLSDLVRSGHVLKSVKPGSRDVQFSLGPAAGRA